MKSSFDLKHNLGKITPQSREDLEILERILNPGGFVTAKSPRSVKIKRGGQLIRAKTGRKEVLMKLEIEKVELKEKLRLTGKIIEAPEDVEKGYHTIEIEPKKFLKVERVWKSWEIDIIKAAERKPEPILICILDDVEADFYILKERYKHFLHLDSEVSGKRYDMKKTEKIRKEYYDKILQQLKRRSERVKKIIIAGPAFTKEDIQNLIKQREKEILEKVLIEQTYQTGNLGLQELLKKGLLEKLTKMNRATEETKAIEKLLEEVGKNGKAVYGLDKTKEAIEAGAVELLLVADKKIREFEDLLNIADKMRNRIMVISSEISEEKLIGLGGIAALLRFKN